MQEHVLVAFGTVPLDTMKGVETIPSSQPGEWRVTGDDNGKSDEQDWHKVSMKIILDEALTTYDLEDEEDNDDMHRLVAS